MFLVHAIAHHDLRSITSAHKMCIYNIRKSRIKKIVMRIWWRVYSYCFICFSSCARSPHHNNPFENFIHLSSVSYASLDNRNEPTKILKTIMLVYCLIPFTAQHETKNFAKKKEYKFFYTLEEKIQMQKKLPNNEELRPCSFL